MGIPTLPQRGLRRPATFGRAAACAVACALALPASAQGAGGSGGFTLMPTFSAEADYLDIRGGAGANYGGEAVGRLSPGLRVSSRSGRVQGWLDYTGSLIYRRGREASDGHEIQNGLSASFLAEVVPNRAYVDTRASISRQAISAFGQQSADGSLQSNANSTEVSTLSISPYVNGGLGDLANYEVRLNAVASSSRAAGAADSNGTGGSVALRSPRSGAILGWGLSASQQRSEFKGSSPSTTDNSRIDATLTMNPAPDVRLFARAGRESADEGALADRRQYNTRGGGLLWTPSVRTSLSAELEQRYFGRASHVDFSHRSARTFWSYTASHDTNNSLDSLTTSAPLPLYRQYDALLTSAYPDPASRDAAVLAYLALQGLNPNALGSTGFLTSGLSIQRRQDLSFTWIGQRTTLSLQAYTNSVSQIMTLGDADPAEGEATRQHGYSSILTHALTPTTSVSLGGLRSMTFGTSTQSGNDLKSANISLTNQVGPRASVQMSTRYSVFNSATDPYRETSVSASLSLRF
jgi:uncharacterized protein (PEP-CTERM system associated)